MISGIYHHLLLLWLPVNLFLSLFLVPCNVTAATDRNHESNCSQSLSCGEFNNIKCPFTLKGAGNPHNCSFPVELVCDAENRTIYSILPSQNFYLIDISYELQIIRIVDPGLQKDNCSSMPRYSLSPKDLEKSNLGLRFPLYYMDCSTPVDSPYYVDTSPCIYPSSINTYSYVVSGATPVKEAKGSCKLWMISGSSTDLRNGDSYIDIHSNMSNGLVVLWKTQNKSAQGCFPQPTRKVSFLVIIQFLLSVVLLSLPIAKFVLGTPFVIAFMIYTFRRRRRAMDPGIEDYLHDYSNQMPIRYSYSDVKKMAKNFKEKLGQGGYGTVFKGVLSNNRSVAIKIMAKTKGNGQEFINEVASIGRIHHVNIVRLIGFVAERSKRALVYEFMPNGSLEKYIFPQEGNLSDPLSWMKMFEIALGIARGMDYLHRGCEMQILHFDIKPHNILLDENFIPKISDFGLAKLYLAGDSIVSMTAARGTIGYLAPELLFRNIGGVSYKSDVYSFGVMLLEMAGRRKNVNAFAENSSQIYFPTWVYDRLSKGKDIETEDIIDEEQQELAKKMIMVGLWCIQMKPIDRPSMLKVIEMLEGDLELLQMPPKPNVLPDEDGNAISID